MKRLKARGLHWDVTDRGPVGAKPCRRLTTRTMGEHALELSNTADDVSVPWDTIQRPASRPVSHAENRARERATALIVAAFICWASGGAYALRPEDT